MAPFSSRTCGSCPRLPTPGQLGNELVIVQMELRLVVDLVRQLQHEPWIKVVVDAKFVLLTPSRHVHRPAKARQGPLVDVNPGERDVAAAGDSPPIPQVV